MPESDDPGSCLSYSFDFFKNKFTVKEHIFI